MGCDIHAHIEVKVEDKWRHFSTPSVERNYRLFALMAGVRNYDEIEPIAEPKGLPEDITYLTKIDYEGWKLDAHDESFLTVRELVELDRRWRYYRNELKNWKHIEIIFHTYIFGGSLTGWYQYPQDNTRNIEDLRVVFWFDN